MSINVYYVAGLPRSGSTFLGDFLARELNIINAGEVWQTFRSIGLVEQSDFAKKGGYWYREDRRLMKNRQIIQHPLWAEVLERSSRRDPYEALVDTVSERSLGIVDCSKYPYGLKSYERLGCRIRTFHCVRHFSSWAQSTRKHQHRQEVALTPMAQLLLAYLRANSKIKRVCKAFDCQTIFHEQLGELNSLLHFESSEYGDPSHYANAEMFGTPNFSANFDKFKTKGIPTSIDRLCYRLLGFSVRG